MDELKLIIAQCSSKAKCLNCPFNLEHGCCFKRKPYHWDILEIEETINKVELFFKD